MVTVQQNKTINQNTMTYQDNESEGRQLETVIRKDGFIVC